MPEVEPFDDHVVPQSPLRRLALVELAGLGRFRLTELGRAGAQRLPAVEAPDPRKYNRVEMELFQPSRNGNPLVYLSFGRLASGRSGW